jgi:hypothetical protein
VGEGSINLLKRIDLSFVWPRSSLTHWGNEDDDDGDEMAVQMTILEGFCCNQRHIWWRCLRSPGSKMPSFRHFRLKPEDVISTAIL